MTYLRVSHQWSSACKILRLRCPLHVHQLKRQKQKGLGVIRIATLAIDSFQSMKAFSHFGLHFTATSFPFLPSDLETFNNSVRGLANFAYMGMKEW